MIVSASSASIMFSASKVLPLLNARTPLTVICWSEDSVKMPLTLTRSVVKDELLAGAVMETTVQQNPDKLWC